jgi:hypothetical protein
MNFVWVIVLGLAGVPLIYWLMWALSPADKNEEWRCDED